MEKFESEQHEPKSLEQLQAELIEAERELALLPKSEHWSRRVLLLKDELAEAEKRARGE